MTPLFRWSGTYWGFIDHGQVYDRHGRHLGWFEGRDLYDRTGRFVGELRDDHYVLRNLFRAEPLPLAARPPVDRETPPAVPPDRDERDPLPDWRDALPWPLPPPKPPTV